MADSQPSGMTSERVNFIIALSAILISAASFYATYLQADAADKQVRAMTLPLLKFEHGNYDMAADKAALNFTLVNAGIGPAVVKNVEFQFDGQRFSSLHKFLDGCCQQSYKKYLQYADDNPQASMHEGTLITRPLIGAVLPGQSEYEFLKLYKHEISSDLWNTINRERWELKFGVCFCSMLDECYRSTDGVETEAVNRCEG
ncbi:MAG: hypothetical protein HKN50_07480 [Gammaproteobacteria bacterium]|nr:hypothetical protein [Gammaproteobacteria bacterium]